MEVLVHKPPIQRATTRNTIFCIKLTPKLYELSWKIPGHPRSHGRYKAPNPKRIKQNTREINMIDSSNCRAHRTVSTWVELSMMHKYARTSLQWIKNPSSHVTPNRGSRAAMLLNPFL